MIDPEVLKLIEHFANIKIFEKSKYSKSNYKECECIRCYQCNKKCGTYYTVDSEAMLG